MRNENKAVIDAAGQACCYIIGKGIPDHLLSNREFLNSLVKIIEEGFTLHYKSSVEKVLDVTKALFQRLRRLALPLMTRNLISVDELRLIPGIKCKEEIDATLGSAISAVGPEAFLEILPLNLENPTVGGETVGRAYLLPILKSNIMNTELKYFVRNLLPIIDKLETICSEYDKSKRKIEMKVYKTLIHQIWMLLPGFFTLPVDLGKHFAPKLLERILKCIESENELRPILCSALQILVEELNNLKNSDEDDYKLIELYRISKERASEFLTHVSKHSRSILAVLTSVFGATPPKNRGYILSCIQVYLGFTPEESIKIAFSNVETALVQESGMEKDEKEPKSHALMDLMLGMCEHLDVESMRRLYQIVLGNLSNENDSIMQKKAYKILAKMFDCDKGKLVLSENFEHLSNTLIKAQGSAASASKKSRLSAILKLTQNLPDNELHIIAVLLSEVIMTTKEVNKKARAVAFDLLVIMGQRMKQGGVISQQKMAQYGIEAADCTLYN